MDGLRECSCETALQAWQGLHSLACLPAQPTASLRPLQYIERYKQAFGRPGAATALINYYRGAVDLASRYPAPGLQAALRKPLRVPTLLLWGERDTALGQQARGRGGWGCAAAAGVDVGRAVMP